MNTASVNVAREAFTTILKQADGCYKAIKPFCKSKPKAADKGIIHPRQANRFLGLTFLNILSGWEEFLEMSFVRYMTGASALNNYGPRLRIEKVKILIMLMIYYF